MSGTRVPLDFGLPFIVASQELVYGPKRLKRGDAFPWRDLGVSEYDLFQLWIALKVDNAVPPAAKPIAAPLPAQPKPQGRAARR